MITKLLQASELLAVLGDEQSFTKAAERLNVDQSAVSHRTKALEKALGYKLFDRTTRRMILTEAGKVLCRAAVDSIEVWQSALDELEKERSSSLIRISLPSSLAMKWFVPALPSARKAGLDLSVEVKDEHINFQKNEADVAIRFGMGPYPGLHSTHLAHSHLQPVISANYGAGDQDLLTHEDTVFLSDRRGKNDKTDFSWAHYFSGSKNKPVNVMAGHEFDRADLMLQGAISGMGVGLGRTLLIENDIKAGFLIPIGPPVRMKAAYWLVCSPDFAQTERYDHLLVWIKQMIRETV